MSDYEVLEHLKSYDAAKDRKKKHNGMELEVVTREILQSLSERPCALMDQQKLAELMAYLNKFDLVKVEKLQIVNSLPRSAVHLYALVDEFDQRFDDEVCTTLIDKINTLFPLPQEDDEEEEQEEEGEEEEEVHE